MNHLITHDYPDHFSPEDIQKVQKPDTVFVAPQSIESVLKNAGYSNLTLLTPGDKTTVQDIPAEAIRAYNIMKPFHSKKTVGLAT